MADEIKPVKSDFSKKLKEDKGFLLAMIDDPIKAFRAYGYNGDEKMLSMLEGMANNIRQRGISVFNEILGLADSAKGCEACDGCRACKACTSLTDPFSVRF